MDLERRGRFIAAPLPLPVLFYTTFFQGTMDSIEYK